MFKGEKVIIRAYRKEDTAQAHQYFNILESQYMLNPGIIGPISYQEEEKYIEMAISCNKERTGHFALETLDGKYIGGCSYMQRDSKSGFCYIGIAIPDKKYQHKGHGTDAMKVLLNYLYYELNIRKVILNVFAYNTNAIKCYKKLGFVEEGLLKNQIYRNGTYHDEVIMALFKDDFKFQKNFVEIA